VIDLTFEWDDDKAGANIGRHGISFEEAKTVLSDPLSFSFHDMQHSRAEVRYITLGLSDKNRLLVVVHTVRGSRTRIISSRVPTSSERRKYEDET
jgi:uncharacterized DUF497 family protein